MHGAPALAVGFDHFPYANPVARGGPARARLSRRLRQSLNPYNVKALSTAQGLIGDVYQSLMACSADEPFTLYGLIAQSIKTTTRATGSSSVSTRAAHFSDGTKIVAADVLFTFELLETKGLPVATRGPALVRSARPRPAR